VAVGKERASYRPGIIPYPGGLASVPVFALWLVVVVVVVVVGKKGWVRCPFFFSLHHITTRQALLGRGYK
jgi:hypothetical protein